MARRQHSWFRSLCVILAYLLYFDTLSWSALSLVPRAPVASGIGSALGVPGSPALAAAVLYVDATDPTCGGHAPCFGTIQSAIDVAGRR